MRDAILCEGIQEAVCGRVGCLTSVSYGAGCRGEHNEEVEGSAGQGMVEVPCPGYLCLDNRLPLIKLHFLEENVLIALLAKKHKTDEANLHQEP